MTREETAEIAAPMWEGDKPYQVRARLALPLLVRQAKAGKPIPYGKLAKELCMPNARNLNYPLGSIRASLQLLGEKWEDDIPPGIQVLVVNKNTGLPGTGIALSPDQVKPEQDRVYAYLRWDDVLRDLNLEPATSNATLVEAARDFESGGESEDHLQLKNYVRDHPEIIGLQNESAATEVEKKLLSGDRLDVSFKSSQHWTAVEVKSAKSHEDDLKRGVFQCVKYKAVMSAELVANGKRKRDFEVEVILAVEGELKPDLLGLVHTLDVDVCEIPVGIYRT